MPVLSGLTADNVKLKAMKRSREKIGYKVAVMNAEGLTKTTKEGKKFFYPALVEWRPGHAFMRPSYDTKGPAARDATLNELLAETLREVEK